MKLNAKLALAMVLLASPLALTACFEDNRTTGEKIDDAATDLEEGRGVGNAAEELGDKTPGERVGDAVEDAGQSIEKQTD